MVLPASGMRAAARVTPPTHAAGRAHHVLPAAAAALLSLCSLVGASPFVPASPATEWLELTALRRPGFAYVHANLPLKSLVAPLAFDGACGFTPPTRDTGCFPAALNWLYSQHGFDRTDAFLRLHAVGGTLVTPRSVARAPGDALLQPSALPGDVLLAKLRARTVRQALPVCRGGDANATATRPPVCERWSPFDAAFGDERDRWAPAPPAFSGVSGELYVDSKDAWNPASSPRVVAQGAAGGGHLLYTKGMVHSADPRLAYPTLTAFQYVFLSPKLTVLAELVNATCFCPPEESVCWHAWLCLVLDQAVLTLLAPADSGWGALSSEALHLLFTNRNAGFLTVAYHILGPAVFSKARPFLNMLGESPTRRRLSVAATAATRRLGDAVNERLTGLLRRRRALEDARVATLSARAAEALLQTPAAAAAAAVGSASAGAPHPQGVGDAAADGGDQGLAAAHARLLSLGEIGEQSLAGFEETGGFPADLDDTLLWRSAPGVLPFNSFLYLAQIKDTLRVSGPILVKTFSSLVVHNHTPACNESRISINNSATGPVPVPWPATPTPVPADWPVDDPEAVIRPVLTNESVLQRAYEGVAFPINDTTLRSSGPCSVVRPARLIASLGDPYPCKPRCGRCDSCSSDCGGCRAAHGYGSPSCAARCACAPTCDGCTSCRWAFPLAWRRLRADGSQGAADSEGDSRARGSDERGGGGVATVEEWGAQPAAAADDAADAADDDGDDVAARAPPSRPPPLSPPRRRALWADECLRVTFTGTERPLRDPVDCALWEPTNTAVTLCDSTDIETLNGLVHVLDRPLLPPPVLTALYAAGAAPFTDGPHAVDPLPSCAFTPADDAFALPFLSRAEFFQ